MTSETNASDRSAKPRKLSDAELEAVAAGKGMSGMSPGGATGP
jgi:hypothetical protein